MSERQVVSNEQLEILQYAAELCTRSSHRNGVEVVPEMLLRLVDEVKQSRAQEPVIAAAEERGRRRGVEERDEYARALYDLFMSIPPPQNPRWQAAFTQALPLIGRIKREELAPRDSGKEG